MDMLGFRVLLLGRNLEPFQKCVLSSGIFFVFRFGIFFSGSCILEVGLSSTILGLDNASFPVVIFFYQLHFVVQIFPDEESNGHLVSTDFRYPPLLCIPLNPIITTVGSGVIEERHSMSQWLSLSSCCTYL